MTYALASMISEDLTCFDVMKVMYALTDSEVEILSCIHHLQPVEIKGIMKYLPKDRTTITRAIQRLMGTGAIIKVKVNLPQGGYQFQYSSLSMEELRNSLVEQVEKIMENMKTTLLGLTEEKCDEMFEIIKKKYEEV